MSVEFTHNTIHLLTVVDQQDFYLKGADMKRFTERMAWPALLLAISILSGCGGYANTANGNSSFESYGVIDAGVQHESR